MIRRTLFAAALLATLAGCGDKPSVEFPAPPADKLVCPDEPAIPEAPVSDAANTEYLKGLRGAWASCKRDVDWLRVWFRELK